MIKSYLITTLKLIFETYFKKEGIWPKDYNWKMEIIIIVEAWLLIWHMSKSKKNLEKFPRKNQFKSKGVLNNFSFKGRKKRENKLQKECKEENKKNEEGNKKYKTHLTHKMNYSCLLWEAQEIPYKTKEHSTQKGQLTKVLTFTTKEEFKSLVNLQDFIKIKHLQQIYFFIDLRVILSLKEKRVQ